MANVFLRHQKTCSNGARMAKSRRSAFCPARSRPRVSAGTDCASLALPRNPQYLSVYRALGLLYFATRSATAAVMRHQPNTAERGKGAGPLIGGPLSATPLLVQAWTNQKNAKPRLNPTRLPVSETSAGIACALPSPRRGPAWRRRPR